MTNKMTEKWKVFHVMGKIDLFDPFTGALMIEDKRVLALDKKYVKEILAKEIAKEFHMNRKFVQKRVEMSKLIIVE